jgi:hypothetical protein
MSDYMQVSKFSKRAEENYIHFICIVDSGTSRGRGVVLQPLAAECRGQESGKGEIKILIKNVWFSVL